MSDLHEEIRRLRLEIREDAARRREDLEFQEMTRGKRQEWAHDESYRDRTWLYIKSYTGDAGDRPIPGGTVFWNSPDVELFDGETLIATNELKEGNEYEVQVTVSNGGDYAATACTVDLFICDPSLSLTLNQAKFLGVQSTEVAPHDSSLLKFSFKAGAEDVGHRCLFARAYSAITKDLPLNANNFDTPADRHIAQQNLSIVKQGEAFMMEWATFFKGNMGITIRPQAALQHIVRYRFAQNLRFREARLEDQFEILETRDGRKMVDVLVEIQTLKQRATVRPGGPIIRPGNRPGNRVDPNLFPRMNLAKLKPDLIPLVGGERNRWQLEARSTVRETATRAIVGIPQMELGDGEASVYVIELHDEREQVTGGITLVVTG